MSAPTSVVFETPTYQATTSTGKPKYWIGRVYNTNGVISTDTEYWQEGHVHQFSARTYPLGKQSRNDLEQAILEIEGDAKKKVNKGYVANAAPSQDWRPPALPMLAHGFTERGKVLPFPCFAQVKENGHRAMYDGTHFWTRGGKQYIPAVVDHLHVALPEGVILDGELVLPDPYTFQDSAAAIKKFRSESRLLEFRVYDCYLPNERDASMSARLFLLGTILHEKLSALQRVYLVKTWTCESLTDLEAVHASNVLAGHEGTMARSQHGLYKPGHRTVDLLKIKDMQDAEFRIVAFAEGQGKDAGTVIFTCAVPGGQTFNVRPKGSDAQRRELFRQGPALIGKDLTVQYQALTDGGLPQFPVGLGIRD